MTTPFGSSAVRSVTRSVSPAATTLSVADSDRSPTSDGTSTEPPGAAAASATPPPISARRIAPSTATDTHRTAPGDRLRLGVATGATLGRRRVAPRRRIVLIEEVRRAPSDLRRLPAVELAAEAGERQRLRRGENPRRIGERGAHGGGVGIALGGIGTTGALDDRPEPAQRGRCDERGVRARGQRADGGVGDRRHRARHRLHQHDREGVEVGAAVERCARGLFRRGIAGRPHHRAGWFGPTRLGEGARETEVGHPHDPVLVEEQVRGLDVAVDDAARVRVLECARDLAPDVGGLRRAQPGVGIEETAQAPTGEQLEHHERDVVLAPVVHRHHVGVVERRRHLGLGAEPAEEAGVLRQREVEDLDPDPPLQAHVVGHVDATTRACTDRSEQAVPAGEHTAGEVGDATTRHRGTVPAVPSRAVAPGRGDGRMRWVRR